MSDEKQGERFIVVEAGPGTGAFLVDLSESFATLGEATDAAQQLTIPGGEKLIVIGIRFCATIVPPAVRLKDRRKFLPGSPRTFPAEQRPMPIPNLLKSLTTGIRYVDDLGREITIEDLP